MTIDKATLREHLENMERSHLKPDNRISSDFFEELLADDFIEFGSSGGVSYKKDCIGEDGVGVRDLSLNDFEISLLSSDVVLATYRVKDKTRQQDTLRSTIWKFRDGRWQMFFHQGTIVKP
ncbi:hypothetical protein J2S77_001760 [Alkalibacillus salilacus]|uniref:DUF4440 domain-containing protein n=2 Tax=Alkalibacillus salilacus TaxID=284582 RepID=A0ABT9VFM5_9BACI|nr:hypothetical protein [Alkalibacillus salilacus]